MKDSDRIQLAIDLLNQVNKNNLKYKNTYERTIDVVESFKKDFEEIEKQDDIAKNSTLIEFGYKQCEKGENLQKVISEYVVNSILK